MSTVRIHSNVANYITQINESHYVEYVDITHASDDEVYVTVVDNEGTEFSEVFNNA